MTEKISILPNPYINEIDCNSFLVHLNEHANVDHLRLIQGQLLYTNWTTSDIDIFQYLTNIREFKRDPNAYFVFDASNEGFSPFIFFEILYQNCKMYRINPKKVIFISTNMLDEENIKKFNEENNINRSIRVFTFLNFRGMVSDQVEMNLEKDVYGENLDTLLNHFKKKTKENYKDKKVLSLSRLNRYHRTLGTYYLSTSDISNECLMSHDAVSDDYLRTVAKRMRINLGDLKSWSNYYLPMYADTKDFKTNHAEFLNSTIYNQTILQIVNETHTKDWNESSLFYSEKTFKPIAHMQPFLIYGQKNCNKRLEDFGFKLHRNLFDYSFDEIRDPKERYLGLLETVKQVVYQLRKLSREEQIEWKFSDQETLKHNFQTLIDPLYERKRFKKFAKSL